jgi:hypothetical protein
MTHTWQRRPLQQICDLVPNFAARWHSFCKYFFTSEINNKMKQTKAPTYIKSTHLHLKKKIPTTENPGQKQQKIKTTLRKNKKRTPCPCSYGCHIRSCSHKIFVKAISSTHDEVALTKGNNGKLTPPHNVPAIIKKTYPINNRELVPNFAARWQLFQKILLHSKTQRSDETEPKQHKYVERPDSP